MTPRLPPLTTDEVAALVQQTPECVRRWCRKALIYAIKTPGGAWRVPQDEVDAILSGARRPEPDPSERARAA